ncbi:outer membrane lipid asymmetry maintenance protein MlaD [Acidiphilium acidophilum]|uniref:outer membrane lipid asymmetry maintenance protein MlaD n=1 Tax=Acidiphilium acidophilum TaxID=76588 RepID=UPI002E8E73E0|nr:outer membrane lipid asymmetry maintenance protein MlaD [Acidiphilium acidophilum]
MQRRLSEVIAGLAVIVVAVAFLVFAFSRTHTTATNGYVLHAQFGSIGPLKVGSPVKIAGVTVGHVEKTTLNQQTYAAIVDFMIDPAVKIPKDSSAAIESASLLGGDYLSIAPGGSDTMLKPGGQIVVTQSAINIESLLGKFVFSAANFASSTAKGAAGKSGGAASDPAAGAGGKTALPGLTGPAKSP